MSLEQKIETLTLSVEKLTATLTSKLGEAAFSAASNAEATTTEAKAPAKAALKKAPAKKPTPPADELDELNDDTPADDGLGLDDDDGLGLDDEPVTKEKLKEVFVKLSRQKGGREAVQDILKSLKATSFTDLKEADFAKAYAKVNEALA